MDRDTEHDARKIELAQGTVGDWNVVREIVRQELAPLCDAVRGIVAQCVNDAFMQERQRTQKEARKTEDRRRHCTRMLLEHYHSLKAHVETAAIDVRDEIEDAVLDGQELHDMMTRLISKWDARVQSIEESAVRTYKLMRYVDSVLAVYQRTCLDSGSEYQARKWRCIEAKYLSTPAMSTTEIARIENYDERTIQRDIRAALIDLGVLLFGWDGLFTEE